MYNLYDIVQIILKQQEVYGFKDETNNFNNNIGNTDSFQCLKYKAKLLGNSYSAGTKSS